VSVTSQPLTMLLKDMLDREFYVGNRLCRIEPVFAECTKALLQLCPEEQRLHFNRAVSEGKATKHSRDDGSTEYHLRPPLIEVESRVAMFDDGIDPMQWVTND
jgi:hypothetical protein